MKFKIEFMVFILVSFRHYKFVLRKTAQQLQLTSIIRSNLLLNIFGILLPNPTLYDIRDTLGQFFYCSLRRKRNLLDYKFGNIHILHFIQPDVLQILIRHKNIYISCVTNAAYNRNSQKSYFNSIKALSTNWLIDRVHLVTFTAIIKRLFFVIFVDIIFIFTISIESFTF